MKVEWLVTKGNSKKLVWEEELTFQVIKTIGKILTTKIFTWCSKLMVLVLEFTTPFRLNTKLTAMMMINGRLYRNWREKILIWLKWLKEKILRLQSWNKKTKFFLRKINRTNPKTLNPKTVVYLIENWTDKLNQESLWFSLSKLC